jgi:hypothetical protein
VPDGRIPPESTVLLAFPGFRSEKFAVTTRVNQLRGLEVGKADYMVMDLVSMFLYRNK